MYLLEDEQELSLGMLICPKRIYNFCLFHAYIGDIAKCFATLSYLFQHIWTNLLTRCPIASFCLLLSMHCRYLPIFKVLENSRKNIKKSAGQKLPDARGRAGGRPPPL